MSIIQFHLDGINLLDSFTTDRIYLIVLYLKSVSVDDNQSSALSIHAYFRWVEYSALLIQEDLQTLSQLRNSENLSKHKKIVIISTYYTTCGKTRSFQISANLMSFLEGQSHRHVSDRFVLKIFKYNIICMIHAKNFVWFDQILTKRDKD